MNRPGPIVRQTSKTVEKIPDDECEEVLLKKHEEFGPGQCCDQSQMECSNNDKSAAMSNNLFKPKTEKRETNDRSAELTVNGNVHIIMPNSDNTCGGAIRYRNGCGDEQNDTDMDKKIIKRKGIFRFLKSNCSRQTILNITFGLLIVTALIISMLALLKNTNGDHNQRSYIYCYPCQNINKRQNMKHFNNMCCTDDPVEEFPITPVADIVYPHEKPAIVAAEYNGSRILEFQADFFKQWKRIQGKDIIPWKAVTNIKKSFASFGNEKTVIKLLSDGRYVITLSLTTDTYNVQARSLRANACIVFELPGGRIQEECRIISHTGQMVVPFQIFRFDNLKKGTTIHAYISSSESLDRKPSHNKLYLVLL